MTNRIKIVPNQIRIQSNLLSAKSPSSRKCAWLLLVLSALDCHSFGHWCCPCRTNTIHFRSKADHPLQMCAFSIDVEKLCRRHYVFGSVRTWVTLCVV